MSLPTVPNPGQTLGNSRPIIQNNFTAIGRAFIVDHVDYNTTNEGMHNRVSFPTQSSPPAAAAGIVQMYSQTSILTNQPELVFLRQTGSTKPTPVEFTSAGWANPGWCRLPSGILMKWGQLSTTTYNTLETIAFPVVVGIPVFTEIYSCQLTVAAAQTDTQVVIMMGSFTTTTVNAFARKLLGFGSATPFTFFAIGI